MKIIAKILLPVFFLIFGVSVYALDLGRQNNIFGIHLAVPDEKDIKKAGDLVNSSGGKWGYITLVMQANDLDHDKWQSVFDNLRKLKLIPIIRLATQPEGDKWRRPTAEDVDKFISFLNSLNWVVKDRYIVLFNEPNHGSEWGGTVDAADYAKTALDLSKKLREKNSNFFIMLAGLDASAPASPPFFEDEGDFLNQVLNSQPDLFSKNLINGWDSHSYPNPGFGGSPYALGRGTVRTYEWELNLLRNLGITNDLPVFITETGWSKNSLSPETIADFIKEAYEQVWLGDSRIRAVTPFILNYQGEPFAQFSYQKPQNGEFYPQFYTSQGVSKKAGDPEIEDRGQINFDFPKEILVDSNYHFLLKLKNKGQAIWDKDDGYKLKLAGKGLGDNFFSDLKDINPLDDVDADFYFKTETVNKGGKVRFSLYKGDQKVLESKDWSFKIIPLPSLKISAKFFPKIITNGNNFEIQIFDQNEQVVYKKKNIKIKGGKGFIEQVRNVYPGGRYRIVVLYPYYLPRQAHLTFNKGLNEVKFERMLPLDFDNDGNFDFNDMKTLFSKPLLLRNLIP